MKKLLTIMITLLCIGVFAGCDDPYEEVTTNELIELPNSDDTDDEEEKPDSAQKSTTGG
ncbi:MAG: hypothetical protein WBA74_18695 [Cyclobacteriaceae bacterium]